MIPTGLKLLSNEVIAKICCRLKQWLPVLLTPTKGLLRN